MSGDEQHEMVLEGPRPSGAEEWSCPECGYRFVVRWAPRFERVVLEEGDVGATHVGVKGDLRLGQVDVAPTPDAEARRWLNDIGIEWDGPAA
jgi:hypothetical protein